MTLSENVVMEAHQKGDYSATLFRYPLVYGPRQLSPREWSLIRRFLDGRRKFIVPNEGLTMTTRGYVENMAHAVLLAVDHPEKCSGEIYNVGGADRQGTRFIATQESPVHVRAKQKIQEATEEETVIISHVTGIRCRVILNELAKAFLDLPEVADRELLMNAPSKLKRTFEDGDIEQGSIAAGQVCGMINDIPTCRELIERIVTGAEKILGRINARCNSSGD